MGHIYLIDIGAPNAFKANIESSATNMMGHGRELIFKATNMELIVSIMAPIILLSSLLP
jgi:hypothetical protein